MLLQLTSHGNSAEWKKNFFFTMTVNDFFDQAQIKIVSTSFKLSNHLLSYGVQRASFISPSLLTDVCTVVIDIAPH
jgi:hypothetical protein